MVPELLWLISGFLCEFQSNLLILTTDEWFTSCGMASGSFLFQDIQNLKFENQILAVRNACAVALIDFPSFVSFKMACFPTIVSSLVVMLVNPF